MPDLSVCLSSVTFQCFVQTKEAMIMHFSLSGSKIILVSGAVKIVWKFAGITLSEGVKVRPSTVASENLLIMSHNLETVQDRMYVTINH